MITKLYDFVYTCLTVSPIEIIQSEKGKAKRLEKWLSHGGDPNTRTESGYTFLAFAIYNKKPEMITLLLQRGADPNFKMKLSIYDRFAINIVFYHRKSKGLARLLLTYGSQYEQLRERLRKYRVARRSINVVMLRWMDEIDAECKAIFNTIKSADMAFESGQFAEAKELYIDAALLLDKMARIEESESSDPNYKTNIAYFNDYCFRADLCRGKAYKCDCDMNCSETEPLLERKKNR